MSVCLAAFMLAAGAGAAVDPTDPLVEFRTQLLGFYGGGTTAVVAEELGVQSISGKSLDNDDDDDDDDENGGPITDEPPSSPSNVAIRYFPNVSENEPTVAVNPRDPNKVVAGTHFTGDTANRCVAHYSRDGGRTWSPIPIFMPQLSHDADCSDPVLAYAPDGSRVYYAYLDLDLATTFKVLVSYSDDDGKSWTGPIVVLSNLAADYDKPWIGTHVPVGGTQSNRNRVYVSATRFDFVTADCHIDFTRSADKGITWSAPQKIGRAHV